MTDPFPEDMDVAGQIERIGAIGSSLVDAAVARAARDAGRTIDEQWARMADGHAFQAIEQDPRQRQLCEYAHNTV